MLYKTLGLSFLAWVILFSLPTIAMGESQMEGRALLISVQQPVHVSLCTVTVPAQIDEITAPVLAFTLTPKTVIKTEAFLVQVQLVQTRDRSDADGEAPIYLGTVSFFPPPLEGQARRFRVMVPEDALIEAKDHSFALRFSLVSAAPTGTLNETELLLGDINIEP